MIIVSIPRCGATRYCLDLQTQTGLNFVGEINPDHIGSVLKSQMHETGYQPNFSYDYFVEILHNSQDKILLVNRGGYLLANVCDKIILRKNMVNAFMSFANFLIKMYPKIDTRVLMQEINISISDYKVLKSYINKYPKDVIWYEDYYGIEDTSTPLLDQHRHSKIIKRAIKNAFETN